jgi:heme/copper-type cytochrome/quinol oxidase subunit 4
MQPPRIRQVPNHGDFKGPLAAIVVSILAAIGWLVFILLYALFWSKGLNLFQNIIVTLASLFIVALLIGLMWVVWGFSQARRVGRMGWWEGP